MVDVYLVYAVSDDDLEVLLDTFASVYAATAYIADMLKQHRYSCLTIQYRQEKIYGR